MPKNMGRGYTRYQEERISERKYSFLKKRYGEEDAEHFLKNGSIRSLSKNKTHCSCWLCRPQEESISEKRQQITDKEILDII